MPGIPALGRLKQEKCEFMASLGYKGEIQEMLLIIETTFLFKKTALKLCDQGWQEKACVTRNQPPRWGGPEESGRTGGKEAVALTVPPL